MIDSMQVTAGVDRVWESIGMGLQALSPHYKMSGEVVSEPSIAQMAKGLGLGVAFPVVGGVIGGLGSRWANPWVMAGSFLASTVYSGYLDAYCSGKYSGSGALVYGALSSAVNLVPASGILGSMITHHITAAFLAVGAEAVCRKEPLSLNELIMGLVSNLAIGFGMTAALKLGKVPLQKLSHEIGRPWNLASERGAVGIHSSFDSLNAACSKDLGLNARVLQEMTGEDERLSRHLLEHPARKWPGLMAVRDLRLRCAVREVIHTHRETTVLYNDGIYRPVQVKSLDGNVRAWMTIMDGFQTHTSIDPFKFFDCLPSKLRRESAALFPWPVDEEAVVLCVQNGRVLERSILGSTSNSRRLLSQHPQQAALLDYRADPLDSNDLDLFSYPSAEATGGQTRFPLAFEPVFQIGEASALHLSRFLGEKKLPATQLLGPKGLWWHDYFFHGERARLYIIEEIAESLVAQTRLLNTIFYHPAVQGMQKRSFREQILARMASVYERLDNGTFCMAEADGIPPDYPKLFRYLEMTAGYPGVDFVQMIRSDLKQAGRLRLRLERECLGPMEERLYRWKGIRRDNYEEILDKLIRQAGLEDEIGTKERNEILGSIIL